VPSSRPPETHSVTLSSSSPSSAAVAPGYANSCSYSNGDSRESLQNYPNDIPETENQAIAPESDNQAPSPAPVSSMNTASLNNQSKIECSTSRDRHSPHSPPYPDSKDSKVIEHETGAGLVEIAIQAIQAMAHGDNLLLSPFESLDLDNRPPSRTFSMEDSIRETSLQNKYAPALSTMQPIQSTLDNILSYMETRGRRGKKRKLECSPYFEESRTTRQFRPPTTHNPPATPTVSHAEKIPIIRKLGALVPKDDVKDDRTGKSLTLILSSALLQSEREIVRELEHLPPDSKLIYRDYGSSNRVPSNTHQMLNASAPDADIIVSPSTGIVLTTSQETTQRYLPGQRPKLLDIRAGTPYCDSPLQERIFPICTRYDRVYVLIRLPVEQQPEEPKVVSDSTTLDIKNVSAIRCLYAFCQSLSEHSTVIPCLVSRSPSSVVDMICSIAEKQLHAINYPSTPQHHSRSADSTIPTHREADEHTKNVPNTPELFIQEVTQWELFLRQAGLNPFAAQLVLGFMERTHAHRQQSSPVMSEFSASAEEDTDMGYPEQTMPAQGLSAFIEMSPAERASLFDSIIGERVLRRVTQQLDKEWFMQ
jgi:hypothetical protein